MLRPRLLINIRSAHPALLLLSLVLASCGEQEPVAPVGIDESSSSPKLAPPAPCTGCFHHPDTLKTQSAIKIEPDSGFYDVTTSGTHKGWLTGPAGTDFALRLMRWDAPNNRWVSVKTANVANSSTETLTWSGAAGRYRWRIWSLKGSGAYDFWFQAPGLTPPPPPPPPPSGYVFRTVSAAGQNACAITTADVAYCWGHGAFGQIGDGKATDWANIPQRVLNGPWDTVVVSYHTTCGLRSGKAWCWGSDNHTGALGQGAVLTSCASPFTSTPCSLVPVPVTGNHTFRWLSAGGNGDRQAGPPYSRFACGVLLNGQALCWGSDGSGELGDGAQYPLANPTPISGAQGVSWANLWAGMDHSCGFDGSGKGYCWGAEQMGEAGNDAPPPSSVPDLYGVVTPPAPVLGNLSFRHMDAGRVHSCGVTTAGKVYCWGSNIEGQLGSTQAPDCSSDPRYPQPCSPTPVPIASNLTFTQVTAGKDHSCALDTSGRIWCWGIGINLGAGNPGSISGGYPCFSATRKVNTTCRPTPIQVSSSLTFTTVDAGMDFTCAVSTGGQVLCWGSDFYGLAKTGSAQFVPTPINQPTG